MKLLVALLGFVALASATIHFQDDLKGDWESRWVVSNWKKDSNEAGEWKVSAGKFHADGDKKIVGLQTTTDARFYDISARFPKPFSNKDKKLVVSYSVKHEQNIDCGGGYVKLVPTLDDQKEFKGGEKETQYNIMFGPDICGSSTKKTHFILNHDGKNHLIKKNIPCESDEYTHTYTLIVNPDNTYEIQIDGQKKESGSIEEDFPILPDKKIKDPSKSKPSDWVDERTIDDPNDKKPEGWDDIAAEILDPAAKKPEDWDDELDGEWEAPKIANPEYKGPWSPKKIENPAYKGEWEHPLIDNPDYKPNPNLYAYDTFGLIGLDLWQVKSGSIFSNFILADNYDDVKASIELVNQAREAEKKAKEAKDEEERKKREEEEKAKKAEEDSKKDDTKEEAPKEEEKEEL
jgi:calreticulin